MKSLSAAHIRSALAVTLRILVGTAKQMRAADVQILAGSLAFATVISLVPLLAVSLSVFTAFGGFESLLQKLEPFILQNLVEASGAEFSRAIRKSIGRVHSGALGTVGALGLLVASTKLFHDMETAVQRVWQIENKRSVWARLIVYWLLMFLGPLLLAVALGLLGSKDLGLIEFLPKNTLTLLFCFIAFTSINKFVPACHVHWKSALISSLFATIAMGVVQAFYAKVTTKILLYNKVYGSIASVPIFLIWILVLWWICLAGVALCAAIQTDFETSRKPADELPHPQLRHPVEPLGATETTRDSTRERSADIKPES